jgi:hypothetical protein
LASTKIFSISSDEASACSQAASKNTSTVTPFSLQNLVKLASISASKTTAEWRRVGGSFASSAFNSSNVELGLVVSFEVAFVEVAFAEVAFARISLEASLGEVAFAGVNC